MYSVPVCRFKKVPVYVFWSLTTFTFCTFIFCLLKMQFSPAAHVSIAENIKKVPAGVIIFYEREPLKVLKKAMPVLGWSSFESDTGVMTFSGMFWNVVSGVTRVNLLSPAAVLQSQVSLLAAVEFPDAVVVSHPEDTVPSNILTEEKVTPLSEESLVCIYNTHTGETYELTDGVERLDGRHGGVVTVAAALQEALESKHGIKTARSEKINDLIYNSSYIESEKTARELLADNPNTKALLDIHRDSCKTREQSVVKINGQDVASILLVVGSDARQPFPTWRHNYAFAIELSDKMNEMYPGLSLGVRVKDGRYNQTLHPNAVLVEVGTTKNSIEEAVCSAHLLADALAEVIAGEEKEDNSIEVEE